jgi:uncharacterized membrane protein
MKKLINFVNRNFYNFFLTFLIVLNIAPVIAPILAHLGITGPAKVIYLIYSVFCHQFAWRSIHVHDYQFAWCTRDTFIWMAMLVSGLFVKYVKVKPIKIQNLLLFVIPIALDGGIQTIATMFGFASNEPFYLSNNFLRMVTGSLLGLGLGFWMMPTMFEIWIDENHVPDPRKILKWKKYFIPVLFAGLFAIYIIMVQIWAKTSPNHGPENFLDLKARMPENSSEWLQRRTDAI